MMTPGSNVASRIISTAEMKAREPSTDDTYEEAWFCIDPSDLKIVIPILTKSLDSLPGHERSVIAQVITCMSLVETREPSADDEEAWFCVDPGDLKIMIPILRARLITLTGNERHAVSETVACMALAIAHSEKQELRDGIENGDHHAVLRAVAKRPGPKKMPRRSKRTE